jgi:hypothetical protein
MKRIDRKMSRHEFSKIADQRKAAFKRLRDAVKLLNCPPGDDDWLEEKGLHARGAMYLAGYAVECKLKAVAMEIFRCRDLRELQSKWSVTEQDVFSHGLEAIAMRLPTYKRFRQSPVWKDFAGQVNRWRPSWRYDPADHLNKSAVAFIEAVRAVYNWLDKN